MNKVEALKIVLTDVCCSNGKNFCTICPVSKEYDCEEIECSEEQLLEAVRVLVDTID